MKHIVKNGDSIQQYLNNSNPGDTIIINEGIYNEKIIVRIDGITIEGNGKVVITNNDHFYKIFSDNNLTNTFRTYTVMIASDNVCINNITIQNSSTPSKVFGQAVALHVIGNNFICNNCVIEGAQDTLFLGPLPENLSVKYEGFLPEYQRTQKESHQKYSNCSIIGDVDFIFGCATALFDNCNIISKGKKDLSYISAPAHKKELQYGFLFYKCKLLSQGCENVYLARPWRDYGITAYIDCELGSHISPLGFDKWSGTNRDKTCRFYEYSPNTDISQRVSFTKELSELEANQYVDDFKKYLKI